jgi:hypothetical protein
MFWNTVPHIRAEKNNTILWIGVTRTGFWWGNHSEIEQLKVIVKMNFPKRARHISVLPKHRDLLDGAPSLLLNETRCCFPAVKTLGREVDHSSPSSAVVNLHPYTCLR